MIEQEKLLSIQISADIYYQYNNLYQSPSRQNHAYSYISIPVYYTNPGNGFS